MADTSSSSSSAETVSTVNTSTTNDLPSSSTVTVEGPASSSSSSTTIPSTSLFSGLQAVASNMNKGIRAIGTGIDANLKDATANFVNVNTNLLQSVVTVGSNGSTGNGGGIGGATASLLSLGGGNNGGSMVPMVTTDRTLSQTNELIYRTRDLYRSTNNVSQNFLTREVDISTNSIQSYTKTMKEIHNSKQVLRPLHDSIGSLASSVGNARIVAAKLVNKV